MSEWISVEDELPKIPDSCKWIAVNVFCEDGYVRLYDYNVKSGKWMDGLNEITSRATHWMPLPEPPK